MTGATGTLIGRRAIVTGGGTGLGADITRHLVGAGAEVIVAGRRAEPLESLAAELPGVHPFAADVTDEGSIAALFRAAGDVDIVIANAGAATSAPFTRTSSALWSEMMAVNLTGTFLTFRAGMIKLRGNAAPWGRLIAVASTAGLRGYPYVSAYAAAKHGVVGLVRSLAREVADSGITVNALCPGFLDTDMTDRSVANIAATTGRSPDEARALLEAESPQRRLVRPDEVSAAVLWLCGPGSGAVNGQAIAISGGDP